MSARDVMLTDEQWKKIEPLIPKAGPRPKGGRPRADARMVFEGILWILKTGARWKDLPERHPHPSSCWRRLRQWYEEDVLKEMQRAFLSEPDHEGILEWDEVFVDAGFFPAKKGARESGKSSGTREQSTWWWSMANVFLLEAIPTPRLPAEIKLLDKALGEIRVPKGGPGRPRTRPKRLIGEKAYDSEPARKKMRQRGINLLAPHRKNRRNVNRQDDRLRDRYTRRYIVERTFRWITAFRRLVVRYENHISMFAAFFQLACAIITLRKCL